MADGQVDETIITRFVVEADQALEEAKIFREQVEGLKTKLKELSSQMKGDTAAAAEGMKRAFAQTDEGLDPAKAQQFGKAMSQAIKEVGSASTGTTAQIIKMVQSFIGILGPLLLIKKVIDFLMGAAQAGYEFAKSTFQMEIGVRALQRSGIDITIKDVYDNIEKLRQSFKIFTTKELVVGSAAFLNLVRDMGFTKDQIFSLQNSIATLAVVNGRAMDEVQRTTALAISSGYTEGLQRLGVSINRVNIAQKAFAIYGIKGYTALTEQQRAYATYVLIQEKSAKYAEDLAEYYKSAPGQIDQVTASVKDQTYALGVTLTPLKLFWEYAKLIGLYIFKFLGQPFIMISNTFLIFKRMLEAVKEALAPFGEEISGTKDKINRFIESITGAVNTFAQFIGITKVIDAIKIGINALSKAIENFIEKHPRLKAGIDAITSALKELRDLIGKGKIPQTLGDLTAQYEAQAAEASKIDEMISSIESKITDIQEEERSRRVDIAQNLQDDLAKIERDGVRKRAEIARSYNNQIIKIDLEASRSRAAASRSLANDLAQIDVDIARRKAEIEQKRRDDEVNAEKQFQNKLKRLQEEFLFDLEDAVRARDAKQIRRLQRRYALDKTQLMREGKTDKEERDRRFQQEMADLAVQREQRRQDRMINFQQQLQDIEIQRQQRLEEAAIEYKQQLDDLKRSMDEQRKERLIQYQNQLRDLARSINDRLRLVADGLAAEYKAITGGAKAIYDALYAYFGPNGYIDKLYQYYMERMGSVGIGGTGKSQVKISGSDIIPNWTLPGGFAEGGSFVATRPTTKQFGEKGAELVTAIPLGRVGRNVNKLFGASAGGTSGRSGRLAIALMLSPDLEARIVEKSLGEFSDVMVSVERMR